MLTVTTLILLVYLTIRPVHGQALSEEQINPCRQQTSYSLTNLQSLEIAFYYDVDPESMDYEFVRPLCKAQETMTSATFKFYPGVSTKVNDNQELECYHKNKNQKDCTDAFAAACASQIVDDFASFVCCTADGGAACDCVAAQNTNDVEEFNQCTAWQHPTIKPDQILLANVNAAKGAYPSFDCLPILTFNGQLDACARFIIPAEQDSVKVICAMLAKNTDDACKN